MISPKLHSENCAVSQSEFFENSIGALERLWTIEELADYLKISVSTIRDWIYRRKLDSVRLGRHVRILNHEVEKLIRNSRRSR